MHRLVPAGVLALAVAWVPWMLWSPAGMDRLETLGQEKRRLGGEIQQLAREIERLRVRAHEIKTSPRSVERVARDELGLVRRTELVVQFQQP